MSSEYAIEYEIYLEKSKNLIRQGSKELRIDKSTLKNEG
jgi:hypothetical protein